MRLKLKQKRGFSIGEGILSVFILGVTMLTILTMYGRSLKELYDERDSVVASMLSQEGIELLRNMRDNNWARRDGINDVNPGAFDDFNVSSGSTRDNCRIDISSQSINADDEIVYTSISCGVSYVLNLNANGMYVHEAGTATKFRRRIILNYSNGDDLIATSLVSWGGSNPPDNISACIVKNKCVFSQATLTEWGTGT